MQKHVIILFLIFILVFSYLILFDLFFGSTDKPTSASRPEEESQANILSEPIDPIEEQWNKITITTVEETLLEQAKKAVVEEGYPSFAVMGINCNEQKTETQKHYDCELSAMDGTHPITLTCIKQDQTCIIDSEYGKAEYSFNTLENYKEK